MAEGIIYPKGVVPRREDFRAAQKMRGEVYNFLKSTMEETVESAFSDMGYKQKAQPAGYYADGNAFGYGVDEGVYNIKVGSKTDSYLEKRIGLGGKRIVCELHMTMYPESMTVEMHYKNTEDAAFRGFQEGTGGYMINEKIIMSCANMETFKKEMTKKLKEFAEKEVGFVTRTKLGNEDRMEKSTASVVEGFTLSSLFTDDFETTSNKIMESVKKDDESEDDLLLGDINEEEFVTHGYMSVSNLGGYEIQLSDDGEEARIRYADGTPSDWLQIQYHDGGDHYVVDPDNGRELYLHDFMKVKSEVTTAGAGAGSAGSFGYDVPLGAPRKRKLKTSAPYTEPVNEGDMADKDPLNVTMNQMDKEQDSAGNRTGKKSAPEGEVEEDAKPRPRPVDNDDPAMEKAREIDARKHQKPKPFPKSNPIEESFIQDLDEAKQQAAFESNQSGDAKYVNLHGADNYIISDYYDHQTTVASFGGQDSNGNGNPNTMNEAQRKFEDTPYARRLRENRRETNLRIIPEGKDGDGFWTIVPQSTLDAYKKNHIMGAPGAEGVEVNSKEEEEYNSGGHQKFPGGKAVKKEGTDLGDPTMLRQRQHHWTKQYLKKAASPVVVSEDADNKLLTVLEDANPNSPMVQEQGYTTMDAAQALDLLENGGYHGMLLSYHRVHQEATDPSIKKRYKQTTPRTQTELNERWKRLATHTDGETIRLAESVTPDIDPEPEPQRPLTESVEGLQQLSRDNGLEEGEVIDGKHIIEIEKPNCLAPVYYKVFKEDYENESRAFIWDFNTGTLVNNPGFKVAK